jgi:hypothetical protein
MQYITTKELIANAKACYEARRLTAQLPADEATCLYYHETKSGETCYCAIGASLSAETLAAIVPTHNRAKLINLLIRELACFENSQYARDLQNAHDKWADSVKYQSRDIESHRNNFLLMLGIG